MKLVMFPISFRSVSRSNFTANMIATIALIHHQDVLVVPRISMESVFLLTFNSTYCDQNCNLIRLALLVKLLPLLVSSTLPYSREGVVTDTGTSTLRLHGSEFFPPKVRGGGGI